MKAQEYLAAINKVSEKDPDIIGYECPLPGQITFTGGAEEECRISPEEMAKRFKKHGYPEFTAEAIRAMYLEEAGRLAGSLSAMTSDKKWIHFWI